MDLMTFEQRLKKYKDVKLRIAEEGSVTTITYDGVIFSGKKYGPLWDLFKRYREDKLSDKDMKNIELIEEAETEELTEINDIKPIQSEETPMGILKIVTPNEELYQLFSDHQSDRVKITYQVYETEDKIFENKATGIIYHVNKYEVTLFDSYGAQRTIAFTDMIEYKFYK